MGVPGLFKNIVKKYKNTYYWKNGENIDYFFIDYNAILHSIIQTYLNENAEELKGLTNSKIEAKLIKAIIDETVKLAKVINPNILMYIALDGVVPMGKMHRQRARRYDSEKKSQQSGIVPIWDRSANLSPQTKFMKKFSKKVKAAIKAGKFGKLEVIFSDTSEAGEGEHKIIPYIRNLINEENKNKKNIKKNSKNNSKKKSKSEKEDDKIEEKKENEIKEDEKENSNNNKKSKTIKIKIMNKNKKGGVHIKNKICIMSPDADLINLSLAFFSDKDVLILKYYSSELKILEMDLDENNEYLYLSMQEYQKALFKEWDLNPLKFNIQRIISDHVMLESLGGNDFVKHLPFMRVTNKVNYKPSQEYIFKVYKTILLEMNDYLVKEDYTLNISFFKRLVGEFGKIEQGLGKQQKINIDRGSKMNSKNVTNQLQKEKDSGLSEEENMKIRREHTMYYSPLHPEFEKYKHLFIGKDKIDYFSNNWKNQYYSHFFNISQNDYNEYKKYIKKVSFEYIKTLIWTQKYYFGELTSWDFYYHFRVTPFASDIYNSLKNTNDYDPKFELGEPLTSEQQLAMILPPQKASLLAKKNQKYMTSATSPIIQYYPIDFEYDVLDGLKGYKSETILPKIDVSKIRKYIS